MLACRSILSVILVGIVVGFAPFPRRSQRKMMIMTKLHETEVQTTTIEVCGFKDCKARGGGPRLQKLVHEVRRLVCVCVGTY